MSTKFLISVELDIETAMNLREEIYDPEPLSWRVEVMQALEDAIKHGKAEMKEMGLKIPMGFTDG